MSLLLREVAGATAMGAKQPREPFIPGDVISLAVEGDSTLSGTFTVGAGPALTLPVIGEISLAGVRRADLESHLREHLGRFLKNPVVHAKALIRLLIVGEVAKPGVYAVPADLVLADALTLAGGRPRGRRSPPCGSNAATGACCRASACKQPSPGA